MQARVRLRITMELSSIEVIKRLVRIDAGLSVVPAIAVQEEVQTGGLAAVALHDLQQGSRYTMGVIYKKGRYVSLAARSVAARAADVSLDQTFGDRGSEQRFAGCDCSYCFGELAGWRVLEQEPGRAWP